MNNKLNISPDLRTLVTRDQLVSQLRDLSIRDGELLHVKVSMKSLGPIDGGANTLIDALLDVVGTDGTLVVDAFSKSFHLPLTDKGKLYVADNHSDTYTGYFNQIFIKHPNVVRSQHPIQKFAAIGRLAHELMDHHTAESAAYDVLERMANMGGRNLNVGENIIGVATTHVAIEETHLKKRNPRQGVMYRDADGEIQLYEVNWMGGCSKGCIKFVPEYEKRGFVKRGQIGYAQAMLTDMQGTLSVDREMIQNDPTSFFCDDPTCKDCQLRWDHSSGNWISVKYYSLIKILNGWLRRK